ncbi:hypothetical protein ALC53_07126 [Atta colombica]|uniref:Uncharacterized protein n=1 Tax=Atta colombica TaxID=520822 RepID=A0A195BCQ5_9HYME|nr:hypothetical protein ALC53_07126 [Atta colombica]
MEQINLRFASELTVNIRESIVRIRTSMRGTKGICVSRVEGVRELYAFATRFVNLPASLPSFAVCVHLVSEFARCCSKNAPNEDEEKNIIGFSKWKRAVAHFSVRGKLDYFPSKFSISFWI